MRMRLDKSSGLHVGTSLLFRAHRHLTKVIRKDICIYLYAIE